MHLAQLPFLTTDVKTFVVCRRLRKAQRRDAAIQGNVQVSVT